MSKGYISLQVIARRWGVSADTARAMLVDCPRLKLRRAVRYALEGVEAIEREHLHHPKPATARAARRRAVAMDPEELALRRHFGLA